MLITSILNYKAREVLAIAIAFVFVNTVNGKILQTLTSCEVLCVEIRRLCAGHVVSKIDQQKSVLTCE